jgi:antitoxin HicB
MTQKADYAITVSPLAIADGGGWIAVVPDLPGCMSDGETAVEALKNVEDAIEEWLEAARAVGRTIPQPKPILSLV